MRGVFVFVVLVDVVAAYIPLPRIAAPATERVASPIISCFVIVKKLRIKASVTNVTGMSILSESK
jgi:hypothetical protein